MGIFDMSIFKNDMNFKNKDEVNNPSKIFKKKTKRDILLNKHKRIRDDCLICVKAKQDALKKLNNRISKINNLKKQNEAKNIDNLININSRVIIQYSQKDLDKVLSEIKIDFFKVNTYLFEPTCKNKKCIKYFQKAEEAYLWITNYEDWYK